MATTAMTVERFVQRQDSTRRAGALEALQLAVEESEKLGIPPPVERIVPRERGKAPKLSAEAFELARQVYFLQHGSLSDAARAIVAAGLCEDTQDHVVVQGRLKTWWRRERWPRRSSRGIFAIRDANHDGGLYRSGRICVGQAVGHGPAPKGKPCGQSALADGIYCRFHDPRPEFVAARARDRDRLRAGRRADLVPLAPLQRWCELERRRLLEAARAAGRVHPNNRGWGLLARSMRIDPSALGRLVDGVHHRHPGGVDSIRAATVVRYLEPAGAAFRDVYGYDPPGRDDGLTCRCGQPKQHASETCRGCYEATLGTPCIYVGPRSGRRCDVPTRHPSGVCGKCRRITERVAKPRTGRPTAVTAAMLILALEEYRDVPRVAWAARRMWATDAGDVRDAFKHRKSLTSALVKQFRKCGWTTPEACARAYAVLVDEHGPVIWPDPIDGVDEGGVVPLEPFRRWLAEKLEPGHGGPTALARRTGLDPDRVSRWLRGAGTSTTVRRDTVDRALAAFGDGTRFADVYGPPS